MNDNVKKVLGSFKNKPYLLRMGSKKVAFQLKVPVEDVRKARQLRHQVPSKRVKILILDIETSPMKAWVWRRWKENIYLDQTIQEWFMLSWAGKWLGSDDTFGQVLTPEELSKEDDYRILNKLHTVLEQADIVIAHNGKKFDIPKINTRFVMQNLTPTTSYKQIDTLEVVKKQFGFSSNSLDSLATFFGFDNKDPHDFELWKSCMEGNKDSLTRLLKYNKKDVEILEKIYIKLRPWIRNHPNINVIIDSRNNCCPYCGNTDIEENGVYVTQHYKYPSYVCNKCRGVFRSKERVSIKQNMTTF